MASKPHVLALPLPYQGHIHPMMELSKKLVSAGFMVTFANTQANHERIKGSISNKEKKEEAEGGGGEDLRLVSLEEGFPAEFKDSFALLEEFFKPEMKAAVVRLLARLQEKGPPVSLLVFDLRLLFVQDIAADAGILSLCFWTQNAANFASNLLLAQGHQLPSDDSTLITCVGGVPPFKRSEISGIGLESSLSSFFAKQCAWEPFKRIHEPTWVVLNTFEELEATTLDTLQASLGFRPLVFGPLVNAPSFSLAKTIKTFDRVYSHIEWLQGHPRASVLYIAFGTLAVLSREQIEELVLGLEASQQPFFWVFRPDLCGNSTYTLDDLARRFKSQGVVVDWTSQWHVLSHPAVGGFITHCGWNSVLEGITIGVPMLGWPIFADQFLNQKCLEKQWDIGLGFIADEGNGKLVSRFEIHKKVKELMQGVKGIEMRDKARNLSEAAKRAMSKEGSSHRDLMLVIQSIVETNTN